MVNKLTVQTHLILLGVFFVFPVFGQAPISTLEDYKNKLADIEDHYFYARNISFSVKDERGFQENMFDEEKIILLSKDYFGDGNIDKVDFLEISNNEKLNITLSLNYYGIYRTGGGYYGAKLLSNLDIKNLTCNEQFNITSDIYTGQRRFKRVNKSELEVELRNDFFDKLKKTLSDSKCYNSNELYKAITFGHIKVDNTLTLEQNKKMAVLEALKKAVERVYGIKLNVESTLKDVAEFTEIIKSTTQGNVLSFNTIDDYTKNVDDNLFVLVESILMN